MGDDATAKRRGSYKSSELVRGRLINAAIIEFATHGFEGSSTRAIARRADAHQPQINYHFESKEALWYAVMDRMMEEVDEHLDNDETEIKAMIEHLIRGLVRFAAARPELNRMMIHEASAPSQRLTWLIETHIRPRYDLFIAGWIELREAGVARDVPPELAYHLMIGAASLLHANAPEVEQLIGITPSDPATVQAHADTMVRLFLND